MVANLKKTSTLYAHCKILENPCTLKKLRFYPFTEILSGKPKRQVFCFNLNTILEF